MHFVGENDVIKRSMGVLCVSVYDMIVPGIRVLKTRGFYTGKLFIFDAQARKKQFFSY
jgi:hypothetical protein